MARSVATHQRLELKEVGESNRTRQAQNALPVGQSSDIFNVERLLGHWAIVVRECEYCVKAGPGKRLKFDLKISRRRKLRVPRQPGAIRLVKLPCFAAGQPGAAVPAKIFPQRSTSANEAIPSER